MNERETLARIRLLRTRHIGPITFHHLLQRYGSALDAIKAVPDLAARGGRKLALASLNQAQAEIAANKAVGASLIWQDGEFYPRRLAQFSDSPACLSACGNLHLLNRPSIAIVGARNASINAIQFVENLAHDLGTAGYVVVSGMARGIDAAAHRGSLATGSIGVVAGGVDIIYPPENRDLFKRMKTEGLLLAEMPPGTAPTPQHFPTRNRIIASLSACVIVVEAAARSGSLITAREAADRGTEVMAVPGSPLDPRAHGCNRLIQDGAALVQTADDVITHISRGHIVEMPPSQDNIVIMAETPPSDEDVSLCRSKILDALAAEPVLIDAVIKWCDRPPATVWIALLELELAGFITRHYGNRISRLS